LEPRWRDWIVGQLRKAHSSESIVSIMIGKNFESGFAQATVAKLQHELSCGRGVADGKERGNEGSAAKDRAREESSTAACGKRKNPLYTYQASRLPQANVIPTRDRVIHVLARFAAPEIIVLANVLSDDESAELIRRSQSKLQRSTTVDRATGESVVVDGRTSFGSSIRVGEDAFIASIERRLSELVHCPVDHGEGLHVLRYHVGQQYRPHHDYFAPGSPGNAVKLARGGQRVATLLMYLNDVDDGGETTFPEIGLSVIPRRGHAVYFAYYDFQNQLDPLTFHGGAPVRQGEKWVATKWFRERPRT
jgi:prolyl 4-hydroxylase